MFIADYTFDLSNNGKRAIVFLQYIQQQEYEKCLNYYYTNEALGVKPVSYTHLAYSTGADRRASHVCGKSQGILAEGSYWNITSNIWMENL